MHIRQGTDADLDAILEIHNEAILNSAAIWEEKLADRAERETWLESRLAAGHSVLVAVNDDDGDNSVIGYASYGQWRPRSGYRHTVEDSVYLAAPYRARGVGRQLLTALIGNARAAGHHMMLADIESENIASIGLHESLGFVHVGRLPEIGRKFDRWLDLSILELRL
jgi:L-amino acid N-acyltransferase YncA